MSNCNSLYNNVIKMKQAADFQVLLAAYRFVKSSLKKSIF